MPKHSKARFVASSRGNDCLTTAYKEPDRRRINDAGYVEVCAGGKTYMEHRLMWECENGPIPEGMVIHHLNGIKTDNRIENLAMLTVHEHSSLKGITPGRRFNAEEHAHIGNALMALYRQ